ELFSEMPEARVRGYKPGRFSFNVKGGRCENCEGDGIIKIEMHFLPDVYVPCEVCKGKRYNKEALEVTYRGKTIADVLDMSVEEATDFSDRIPRIEHNLDVLKTADHIIDLGPEGGDKGGQVVAAGTPEEIVRNRRSYTGEYLKRVLDTELAIA